MISTGVVRKIDANGRLVIPTELRKNLSMGTNDAFEIFVEGDSIVLKKYEPTCVFCHSMDEIITYKDKKICNNCAKKINSLFEEEK